MYICAHAYINICMYIPVFVVYSSSHMHAHAYEYVCKCINQIRSYINICMYTYIYNIHTYTHTICMYTYIHISIHTHIHRGLSVLPESGQSVTRVVPLGVEASLHGLQLDDPDALHSKLRVGSLEF
jgi:hypothetical protein